MYYFVPVIFVGLDSDGMITVKGDIVAQSLTRVGYRTEAPFN